MSKNQNNIADNYEESIDDIYEREITTRDYGFILDADGDLKAVFMPTDYFEIPAKALEVFKLFGIDNPEDVEIRTLQ